MAAAWLLTPSAFAAPNQHDQAPRPLADGHGFSFDSAALKANVRDDGSFSVDNQMPMQLKFRDAAPGRTTALDAGVVVESEDGTSQWFLETPKGIEHMLIVEPPIEPGEGVYAIDVAGLEPVLRKEGNVALVDRAGLQATAAWPYGMHFTAPKPPGLRPPPPPLRFMLKPMTAPWDHSPSTHW